MGAQVTVGVGVQGLGVCATRSSQLLLSSQCSALYRHDTALKQACLTLPWR